MLVNYTASKTKVNGTEVVSGLGTHVHTCVHTPVHTHYILPSPARYSSPSGSCSIPRVKTRELTISLFKIKKIKLQLIEVLLRVQTSLGKFSFCSPLHLYSDDRLWRFYRPWRQNIFESVSEFSNSPWQPICGS